MHFEHNREGLLVFAILLEGCSYFGCKDDLKREYVPEQSSSRWQDGQTLEVSFSAPLQSPAEVDPRRFALLRYNVKIESANDYYCEFEVCYREVDQVEMIPDSLDWDPAEPAVLRLHFAEPIPPSSCKPWRGTRADFQALALVYLGVASLADGAEDVEPDQLVYADDRPVWTIGPYRGLEWLTSCFEGGSCELDEFCIDRGGLFDGWGVRDVWIDCP